MIGFRRAFRKLGVEWKGMYLDSSKNLRQSDSFFAQDSSDLLESVESYFARLRDKSADIPSSLLSTIWMVHDQAREKVDELRLSASSFEANQASRELQLLVDLQRTLESQYQRAQESRGGGTSPGQPRREQASLDESRRAILEALQEAVSDRLSEEELTAVKQKLEKRVSDILSGRMSAS